MESREKKNQSIFLNNLKRREFNSISELKLKIINSQGAEEIEKFKTEIETKSKKINVR